MTKARNKSPATSQLRIIGGEWRGRKLSFSPAAGLRPTTDRVRETLFNWLAPTINGARCTDLFAGSGALGLEALSRGAAHCDFVDNSSQTLRQIDHQLELLNASDRGHCHSGPAQAFLSRVSPSPVDIVFVDPPFGLDLVEPTLQLLSERAVLATGALVYVETAAREALPPLPPHWQVHREKRAGEVVYRLISTA